jgi:hypothetical protein
VKITEGSHGINTGEIRILAEPNMGIQRTATITLSADEPKGSPVTLQIIQSAKKAELTIDPVIHNQGSEAGSFTFGVGTIGVGDIHWSAEVTAGNSWARITSGSTGSNEGQISLSVDRNDGPPRTASILVTAADSASVSFTLTIRQDIANGISILETADNLNVYPNPTDRHCIVELPVFNGSPQKLEIHHITGQMASSRSLVAEKTLVDLSSLPAGIYIFRIISYDNRIRMRRVVKN